MRVRELAADDGEWRASCPSCGETEVQVVATATRVRLGEDFPRTRVRLTKELERSRRLVKCVGCSLWYFDWVPSRTTFRELWGSPSGAGRWSLEVRGVVERALQAIRERGRTPGAVLDVGGSDGAASASLPGGWTRVLVDPVTPSSIGAGVTVLHGFLEDLQLGSERFDLVLAFDVLEHFESPGAALRKLADALKPGGLLLIETGNRDCVFARLFGPAWYYLQYLEHLQAFNQRSLLEALGRNGLTPRQADRVRHSTGSLRWRVRR